MKKLILYCFFCLFFCLVIPDFSFAGVTVTGGLARDRALGPGATFTGIIHLRNDGEDAVQVSVHQTDYLFTADGRTFYGEPGSNPRSNATWVSVSPSRLTIPSHAIASIYYAINVPREPDLKGTYWSVVMIEPFSDSGPPRLEEQGGKIVLGVQTKIRYAIQIVTNIGDTGDSNIRFVDKKLIRRDGKTILQTDIENIGERFLSPSFCADLYNENGVHIGRFESTPSRIFPNCSVRHLLDLSGVPKGSYKALLIVDNGDDRVFGASYNLRLK